MSDTSHTSHTSNEQPEEPALKPTPVESLSYAQLLHENAVLASAVQVVHLRGLTEETADEPSGLYNYFFSKPNIPLTSIAKLKVEVDLLRRERIRCGFSSPSASWLAERRPAAAALRSSMLERIFETTRPEETIKPAPGEEGRRTDTRTWGHRVRGFLSLRVYDALETSMTSAHSLLAHRIVRYITREQKLAIVKQSERLKDYCETKVTPFFNYYRREATDPDEVLMPDLDELLWLAAEASLWEENARDAVIASNLCIAHAELTWLELLEKEAAEVGVHFPERDESVAALLSRVRSMAENADDWPKDEHALTQEVDSNALIEDAMKAIESQVATLSGLYDRLAIALKTIIVDHQGAIGHEALNQRQRDGLRRELKSRRMSYDIYVLPEGSYRRGSQQRQLSAIDTIRDNFTSWCATIFQYNIIAHWDKVRHLQRQHEQLSLGFSHVSPRGVAAAISARQARMYEI